MYDINSHDSFHIAESFFRGRKKQAENPFEKICRQLSKTSATAETTQKEKESELRNNNVNRENSHFLLKNDFQYCEREGCGERANDIRVEAYVCYTDFVVSKPFIHIFFACRSFKGKGYGWDGKIKKSELQMDFSLHC
jgi:hypothetical protein